MKIGVSGASGHLGRAVVSELLQDKYPNVNSTSWDIAFGLVWYAVAEITHCFVAILQLVPRR